MVGTPPPGESEGTARTGRGNEAGWVAQIGGATFTSADQGVTTNSTLICGCSSVVERHVANVAVVGSTPITRSRFGQDKTVATGLNSLNSKGVEAGRLLPSSGLSTSFR